MDLIAATPTSPSKYAPIQRHSHLHLGVLNQCSAATDYNTHAQKYSRCRSSWYSRLGITYWLHRPDVGNILASRLPCSAHQWGFFRPAVIGERWTVFFSNKMFVRAMEGAKRCQFRLHQRPGLLSTDQCCQCSLYISGGHLDLPHYTSENRNLIVCGLKDRKT